MRAEPIRQHPRLLVPAQHEQREAPGVAADRRPRLGGTLFERPLGVARRPVPVAGKDVRLQHSDRAAPAPRGRIVVALAVTLDRLREPLASRFRLARHELCQRCARRRISHPRQLPLACVAIADTRQSTLAVSIPF